MSTLTSPILEIRGYNTTYTRCYCEENIYLLCKEIKEKQNNLMERCSVVYISNEKKMVPLWRQKAGVNGQPVVWDYHVILLFESDPVKGESLIYDYDTTLPFPCDADEYVMETFRPEVNLKQQFDRSFRVIPAESYLKGFASDRSHMIKPDGTYHAQPPSYPNIQSGTETMNLHTYISMINDVENGPYGNVHTTHEFYKLLHLL